MKSAGGPVSCDAGRPENNPVQGISENGTELSGSEAQKAALARALYRDSPVIVLDEPTAALDPIAEEQVYSGFSGTEGDRTGKYAELWNAQAQYYAGSSGEGN